MTVLDNAPRDQYTATGGQTVFPYTFEIAAAGDIKVLQNGTLLNQGAGAGEYAVSGVGVDAGGNVTLVTGATVGDIITIYRDMAYERLTSYTNAGDFLAADVNNDFDRLWLALQQNGGELDGRVLIAPNTDPTSIDMTIPEKTTRLGKLLKFNATTGNPEAVSATTGTQVVSVTDFGAVGDGVTDDAAAIQAAIDSVELNNTGIVYFPAGNYKINAGLVISDIGVILRGDGGNSSITKITATHTNGPVIRIKQRSCGVEGIAIDSDATRYAATVADGHGIHYEYTDVAGQSMSRGRFYDVNILRQPLDGIHIAGGFEFGVVDLVTVADCKRHGFVLDDGTRSSRTNKDLAPFQFTFVNSRAIECGGNGLLLGASGETLTTQNGYFNNFEALGCCWSSSTRESLFQVDSRCNGQVFINSDIEDQQYAQTATATTGSTRTANGTPAKGFQLSGSRTTMIGPYFSSLLSSVESAADDITIEHPRIFGGTYPVDQTNAFIFSASVQGVYFKASTNQTTGATNLIQNQSNNADIFIDGKQYKGNTYSLGDFEVHSDGVERTVSGGVLDISEDFVFVKGEGDTTDSVTTLRLASGINGFNGLIVNIINRNAYTITLNHSTGNMYFAAGSNKALAQYQGVTLAYSETGNAWIEV